MMTTDQIIADRIIAVLQSQHAEVINRLDKLNGRVDKHDERLDNHSTEIAVIKTNQKILGGGVVAVAGTLATAVVKWVTG